MGLLLRKARRDVARAKGTFLSLTLMVAVGVMAFTSIYGSYANLDEAIDSAYEDLDLHDGLIEFEPTSRAQANTWAEATNDIQAYESRLVVELPVTFGGDRSPIMARIISIPDDRDPRIDRLDLRDGRSPGASEVVVETGFAAHHDLEAGDSLVIHAPQGNTSLTISGIAASPDYLWPARNVVEHMPDVLRRWGVLYARQSALENWTGLTGQANQIVFTTPSPALPVLDDLKSTIGDEEVLRIETRDNLASNTQLRFAVGALSSIAFVLPLLFLMIVGLSTYVLLSRLVHLQRANIGLLRALGFSPGSVLWHYLSYAPLVAIAGTLLGFSLGFALSFYVTDVFASFTSLADVRVVLRPSLLAVGFALSLAFTTLAAVMPARQAARLTPAAAMRAPAPPTGRRSRLERWLPFLRRAPDSLRLGWRNVGRNPRRALFTILGVGLAVTAALAPLALLDSLDRAIDASVGSQRNDSVAVFSPAVPIARLDEAAQLRGIRGIEPVLQIVTSIRVEDSAVDMTVLGLREDQGALALKEPDGQLRQVSPHGILLTRVFETRGLDIGDTIEILGTPTTILGFVDGFGPTGYVELAVAQQWAGTNGTANRALVSWAAGDEAEGRANFAQALPVASLQDVEVLRTDAKEMLRLVYGFAGFVVAFGLAIAAAVVYNAVAINVLEEGQQHATLRTLGFPMRTIAATIATETTLLVIPGILVGLPLGVWLAGQLVAAMATNIFVLDPHVSAATYGFAVAAGLLPAALGALPSLRGIARLDLGRAARERAR